MNRSKRDLDKVLYSLVLNPLPNSIRNRLLLDRSFSEKLGFDPRFWFPLGRIGSVDAISLHRALRAAVSGKKSAMLTLRSGSRCRVRLGRQRGGKATLDLNGESFSFSNADLLTADRKTRTAAIKRVLGARPLLTDEEVAWVALAKARELTDREYADLMTALDATPEGIRSKLQSPQDLGVEKLVPDDPGYYRRLVAKFDNSASLDSYVGEELGIARKSLLERHPARALRRIAFTALWRPLIPFELLSSLGVSDVAPLLQANDPFSLLFGFELCRDRLEAELGFGALGSRFLEKLLLDEDASTSRCNIFSAVALITTAKLRQAARASSAPLFWVRLAALAHAGVLTDALNALPESERFLRWATRNFYPAYVWHGVIDRRDAPRWRSDWISPDHLYAELVGRVLGTIHLIPDERRPAEWVAAIETAQEKLVKSGKALAAHFPGPFDDFGELPNLSSNIEAFKAIEVDLNEASTMEEVPGIFALAYASRPSNTVVADVLRILNRPADLPIATREYELSFLQLSAHIAGVARSEPLANAIADRCLVEVRRSDSSVAVTDVFAVMVEACAAISDPKTYRDRLGTLAAKLCFAVGKKDDLANLEAVFGVLTARDEQLFPALAKARAIAHTKRGRS